MKPLYCPKCKAELQKPERKENPAGFYWELKCIECKARIITDEPENFEGLASRISGV